MDVLRKRLLQEKKKGKEKDDINCIYTCSFSWSVNNVNLLNHSDLFLKYLLS